MLPYRWVSSGRYADSNPVAAEEAVERARQDSLIKGKWSHLLRIGVREQFRERAEQAGENWELLFRKGWEAEWGAVVLRVWSNWSPLYFRPGLVGVRGGCNVGMKSSWGAVFSRPRQHGAEQWEEVATEEWMEGTQKLSPGTVRGRGNTRWHLPERRRELGWKVPQSSTDRTDRIFIEDGDEVS